ncbi:bifunctional proline dehydrogenase/L-glutamate gamma-semialdehyde dehydrogenase [Amnibacterium kyonggiense]|uniref:L-glutamate gamma-semialdehyde dehydrogenase n=1 Tax=Amnibacterium kyonggiense TaxID=595671 RepID=A0A4R7FQ76_9MICO|nr:bifunctional proline dehydrogenase/L-glutamate gamma-semialdehyde dehydrogenase [Amnibacterium kyonggiense]TDS79818.1 L-proline dehydrogenase /delta-1-pyrroline-5-carboxylate dehydrogenase [Amnibacterium kyonggiense]
MSSTAVETTPSTGPASSIEQVEALVRRWLTAAAATPADPAAARLAGVLRDPRGLAFTVGFVDGVVRPEDLRAAAHRLAVLAPDVPRFLPLPLRLAVRIGGLAAPILPWVVVPIARTALRRMVDHLVIDATPARLGRSIARIRSRGVRLNLNLLGEAVLGQKEADRRLAGTLALIERPDVDYVSIKVSAAVAPHAVWAFDAAVDDVVARLTPLYESARRTGTFINLDMEEYKDLDLTIAVFQRILDSPRFLDYRAGIVLQAYLPDALSAMMRLQAWSAARRARGGAAIKVRLVKGANLPMERVEAAIHDWPLATWHEKVESDTNYKRVLDWALTTERTDAVQLGVAGHNLFDVAHAWLLAGERGVTDAVEFEMLLGMATGQAEAVRKDVGGLLVYTPVVHPREFDVAIAYLVRRLEEGASEDNFMSSVFDLASNERLFARERDRFAASLAALDTSVPPPHRVPRTTTPMPPGAPFRNAVDTDPAVPEHRAWASALLERAARSDEGARTLAEHTVTDERALDAVLASTQEAGRAWGAVPAAERAAILQRAGDAMEAARGRLVEVMVSEAAKTVDQADPEVSEAIDFARYYAARALELEAVDGARFIPAALTLVTPPWNFPVAIPAGGVLAALAAGSGVVLKPAGPASRCGAVLAEVLWSAGVPREVLALVQVDEDGLGRRLVSDERIDRVVLTGAWETARLFRDFRADLPVLAETSGKNAMVVTPSADLDLAVKDLVASAFGHAGQKCSAASLAILVGPVAKSKRFLGQLVDAVGSLEVGAPWVSTSRMGPLIEPASGKLLEGLAELGPGEHWLLEPKRLDREGRLWTPGIRTGVRRGSAFHLTEYFGPVLGIMVAADLDEAIAIQNEVAYGLTAGLQSLEPAEIGRWVDGVQAGNLYVNRGTTGAIVGRQPFGGWKRSSVGAGTKAGGPNYLVGLGEWVRADETAPVSARLDPTVARVVRAASAIGDEARAFVSAGAASDQAAWEAEFGATHELADLGVERNLLRYRTVPVTIRAAADADPGDVLRVVAAAVRAGAPVSVVAEEALPATLTGPLDDLGVAHRVEAAPVLAGRVRLIGGSAADLLRAAGGDPDLAVWSNEVTTAGRIELLPFLHEQSVSITAHRFGTPTNLTDDLV